ncbi:TPA: type II toxin-antitoxin system PemK/MazF family toxin [Streptococcus suis]|nr:type II toxin-antitoxin system PemK/MazF family toxin [Streptococcus suis]
MKKEFIEKIQDVKLYHSDDANTPLGVAYDISKEFAKLEQKITEENTSSEEFQLTISNLKEVIDYYGKYLKQSFAKCDSLQTISKDRILKKNPLDPVGKIKVSPETLDAINAKVKELYF